jgi:hypothetical protein
VTAEREPPGGIFVSLEIGAPASAALVPNGNDRRHAGESVAIPISERHDERVVSNHCANMAALNDNVNRAESVSNDAY